MSVHALDDWVQRVARGKAGSRRRFMGLLATLGLLTGLPGRAPLAHAGKKGKNKKKKLKKRKKQCVSQAGKAWCAKRCVDLATNARHCGGCGRTCDAGQVCVGGECQAEGGCGSGGECLVFATSTKYTGNLGGLSGADQQCQARAQAAGLPGAYRAWLSDSTGSPSSRFSKSTGPYRLVGGARVADDWADLTNAQQFPNHHLQNEINRDEFGVAISPGQYTWTNTATDGTANIADHHCQNWSTSQGTPNRGDAGNVNATDGTWTNATDIFCNNPNQRLYCFQQS